MREALGTIETDGSVAIGLPGRVVLCRSARDVEAALAGRCPPGAVRLDGGGQR